MCAYCLLHFLPGCAYAALYNIIRRVDAFVGYQEGSSTPPRRRSSPTHLYSVRIDTTADCVVRLIPDGVASYPNSDKRLPGHTGKGEGNSEAGPAIEARTASGLHTVGSHVNPGRPAPLSLPGRPLSLLLSLSPLPPLPRPGLLQAEWTGNSAEDENNLVLCLPRESSRTGRIHW